MIGRDRGKTSRVPLGTRTVIQSVQENRWRFRCLKKLPKTFLENGARSADLGWIGENGIPDDRDAIPAVAMPRQITSAPSATFWPACRD